MKQSSTRQLRAGLRSKTRLAHDACLLPPASAPVRATEKKISRRENKKERAGAQLLHSRKLQAPSRPMRGGYSALGYLGETRFAALRPLLALFGGAGPLLALLFSPCCPAVVSPCCPASGCSLHWTAVLACMEEVGWGTTRTKNSRGIDPCPRWARCSFFHSNARNQSLLPPKVCASRCLPPAHHATAEQPVHGAGIMAKQPGTV